MTAPKTNEAPVPVKPSAAPMGWGMALEKAPQFLSVLLIFTLPFLTQLEGQDPLFPKFAVTQIIVYFILGAWAFRVFWTGKLTWVSSRALWVLLALLIWTIVGLAYSPYSRAGFLQMKDHVIYPLWYVLMTFTCVEAWQAENLLVSFLFSGLATGVWALSQVFGIGDNGWMTVARSQFSGRPIAGLGNPDFLAGFLLIVWPLAMALWMRGGSGFTRSFWGLLTAVALFSIFLTGSPGGWLGLAIGTAVFAGFVIKDWGLQGLKWLGLPVILIVASFFISPMAGNLKGLLNPSSEIFQFQDQVWNSTISMIQGRPVLGFGSGTYATAFPPHRAPYLALRETQRSSDIEHASNWFLEWTAETGIVGLLLFLTFWFYVLAQWWKLYSANAIAKPLAVGVFAAVAGIAADNLLGTNSYLPTTLIPLLLLAAFPVAFSQRFYRMEGFPTQRREVDLSRWKIYLLPVLALLLVLGFQKVGDAFQRQGADLDMERASVSTSLGKWDEALDLYDKALKLDSDNISARYFQGTVYLDRSHPGDLEKALGNFDGVEQVAPDYKLLHYQKYEVLLRMGKTAEAEDELKRAVRSDPMLVYLLDDFKKARGLVVSGHLEEALIVYQNLYFDYPTCVPMMICYANCFAMAGNLKSAVTLYQRVLQLDPQNEKVQRNLEKVLEAWKRSKVAGNPTVDRLGSELE